MPDGAAVDTDVLLKAAAYKLGEDLVAVLMPYGDPCALGLTHLIASHQLMRKRNVRDRDGAAIELERLMAVLGRLEPNDGEIAMAADLTAAAQDQGLPLDAGEAQLAAIVACRSLPLLLTGDKRAIGALARLIEKGRVRSQLVGRIASFEQTMIAMVKATGEARMRERVCAEPNVDGTMRLACSCGREPWNPAQLLEACASFAAALRNEVGDLLAEESMLA